jgi:signal transduction histidine kinase
METMSEINNEHDELERLRQELKEVKKELEIKAAAAAAAANQDDFNAALLNMLEDVQEEKEKAEKQRLATLNILEDINDARLELDKSYKKLKGLDSLKDEFTNLGAHELRTPILPIRGFLSMLHNDPDKYGIKGKAKRYIAICMKNIERLQQLVDDILEMSKLQTGQMKFEMEDIDFGVILKDILGGFEPLLNENGVKLKLEIDNLPKLYGDSNRLSEVVSNLMENAKKYTEKGHVAVKARCVNNVIRVDINDTGIGIAKESQEGLFTKYFQGQDIATRKSQGTGLGLSICKQIIEAHGGKIWAESEGLGKGSTFIFVLPLKKRGSSKTDKETNPSKPFHLTMHNFRSGMKNRKL